MLVVVAVVVVVVVVVKLVQQAKNGFLYGLRVHKVVVTYKKQDFVFYLGFLAWFNPPHRQFRFGLFQYNGHFPLGMPHFTFFFLFEIEFTYLIFYNNLRI